MAKHIKVPAIKMEKLWRDYKADQHLPPRDDGPIGRGMKRIYKDGVMTGLTLASTALDDYIAEELRVELWLQGIQLQKAFTK